MEVFSLFHDDGVQFPKIDFWSCFSLSGAFGISSKKLMCCFHIFPIYLFSELQVGSIIPYPANALQNLILMVRQ